MAVGDLDPDEAAAELAAVFSDVAGGASGGNRPGQLVNPDPADWQRVMPRAKAQSAFAMAFPGPDRRDPRRHAAEVWGAIASGLGGRLFEALRDRRSLAYTVVGTAWPRRDGGALITYIATSPAREEEARAAMLTELQRFADERVSAQELRDGIAYLSGQAEVSRQSASAVAGEIIDAWLAGEGLRELEDPGARYRTVTAEAIRDVAASAFTSQRAEGVVRERSAQPPGNDLEAPVERHAGARGEVDEAGAIAGHRMQDDMPLATEQRHRNLLW